LTKYKNEKNKASEVQKKIHRDDHESDDVLRINCFFCFIGVTDLWCSFSWNTFTANWRNELTMWHKAHFRTHVVDKIPAFVVILKIHYCHIVDCFLS